jgi:flavodoxin
MRVLIVCVSVSQGNTLAVADAMATVLHASVREPEDVDPADVTAYDLVGFGSGIFAFAPHERLRRFVARLPHVAGTKAFVFATSGTGRILTRPFVTPLDRQLRDKGFDVVGSFCCPGYDTWLPLRIVGGLNQGRPDAADLTRARDFAEGLLAVSPAASSGPRPERSTGVGSRRHAASGHGRSRRPR